MMRRSGSRFEGRLDGWTSPGRCATVCYMATSSTVPARKRAAKRPVHPASAKSRAAAAPSSTPPVEVARTVHPVTVGVRELRQNLSVYLDRVKQGVAFVGGGPLWSGEKVFPARFRRIGSAARAHQTLHHRLLIGWCLTLR